jgi:hypothetical protein
MRPDMALSPEARKPLATLATIAIVGTAYFVVAVAALHFLSPDINPIQRRTSEYAAGPFGYLMTSAFVSLSLASWALTHTQKRPPAGGAFSLQSY